jgi:hypothetical protein
MIEYKKKKKMLREIDKVRFLFLAKWQLDANGTPL